MKHRSCCIPVMELGGDDDAFFLSFFLFFLTIISSLLYIYRRRGDPATIYKSLAPIWPGLPELYSLMLAPRYAVFTTGERFLGTRADNT